MGAMKRHLEYTAKLEDDYKTLERNYSELKDKYDQLCGKLKHNANDARNTEGAKFLRNYANSWE